MAPIIAAIASMFAKEGLDLLAGAVKGGGKKAVEMIEKKTGIDIKDVASPATDTQITPKQLTALREYEAAQVIDLAKIVASADKGKAGGIIMTAIAPEIPELILFGMGMLMILGFAIFSTIKIDTLASAWLAAFAMYVKGK